MAKILLLGGTGAMGEHLVQLLTNTEHQVSVTSRQARKNHDNITYLRGNAHEEVFLSTLLAQGFDVIVDFMVYNTPEFENRYQRMLESCKQYVYLSSSRVYADSEEPITEDSPRLLDASKDEVYLATDEYGITKARQENLLRQSGKNNYTIIRPYITFSEIRLQLGVLEKENWLYRALKGRTIVFSKDIADNFTTLTYGLNVSEGIAAIINQPKAFGEAFHITVDESHRWSELLTIYRDVIEKRIGKRPKVLMLDKCPNLMGGGRWQVMYDRYYNRRFNDNKIKQFIDTSSFLSTKEGLEKCLNEFIDHPKFLYVDWKAEAFNDRLTGERASLSEMPTFKQKVKYLVYRYLLPDK